MGMDWLHSEETCHQYHHQCSLSGTLGRLGGTADPKKSWRRNIQQEHEDLGVSRNNVEATAQNWARWKAAVEAQCSGRSEDD